MFLEIDGSTGEGGGQILRTSLAMSAILGKPIKIINIRAGRREPGLQAQHLTCVNALAKITDAEVNGNALGSQSLTLIPKRLKPGNYAFDVSDIKSSAGSVSLIFQAIFLPLAFAGDISKVTISGGTHVAWSPQYDYIKMVYLPIAEKFGAKANVNLKSWGWYPKGGGQINIEIYPARLYGIDISERGEHKKTKIFSAISNLSISIAQRQLSKALDMLKHKNINPETEIINAPSRGQGTSIFIFAEYENSLAGFSSLGAKGKSAEMVAEEACNEYGDFIESGMSIDHYLADQIIPLASLAKGQSCFTTSKISLHLLTNIQMAEQFLPIKFHILGKENHAGKISVDGIGFCK